MQQKLKKLFLSTFMILCLLPLSLAVNTSSPNSVKPLQHKITKKTKVHKIVNHKNKKTAKKHSKRKRLGKDYMRGYVTYYSHKFDGRKMANGERYSPNAYTAAHAKLPLGTKLKVINQDNDSDRGRVLYIEVTDRMSPHTRAILDLTPRAYAYLNQKGRNLKAHLKVVSETEFEAHDMNGAE